MSTETMIEDNTEFEGVPDIDQEWLSGQEGI